MTTSTTISTTFGTHRLAALVTRQRASRLRDLAFAVALAIGATLSLGALHSAAADAEAAPVASVATSAQ